MTGPTTNAPMDGARPSEPVQGRPGFAHASEAEFARILDFYQVAWRYEPHAFPILWSLDGDVLESFAPDFYLPELDLYVEMTTLRQKLVRKKNRKLRRLRELYPDVRIKLFYARDFRALMLKYGRVALADALSGSEGQFTPANPGPAAQPHPAEPPIVEPVTTGPMAVGPIPAPVAPKPVAAEAVAAVPVAAAPTKGPQGPTTRRAGAASTTSSPRLRPRPPAPRGPRTAAQPHGIGTDTPASHAALGDEEVVR